ncbi:hypothetical protein MMC17_007289 [Xylographa soralifera]|nr:hypothetical protein [Xylographa soralifera]
MSSDYSNHTYKKAEREKHHWGDVTGMITKKDKAERGAHHWGDESGATAEKREKIEVDKHHWEDEGSGMATNEDGGRLATTNTRESARHHWDDEDAPMAGGIGVETEGKKKGLGGWFSKLKGQGSDEVVR